MVNQHALRATAQFSLQTTSSKILRKELIPDLLIGFLLSTTMLSNFDFLDLKILVVLFQSHKGKETRKSCSVHLAMADRSCICCDRMVMCRTRCAVFLSYEKSQLRFHSTFTNVNVFVGQIK